MAPRASCKPVSTRFLNKRFGATHHLSRGLNQSNLLPKNPCRMQTNPKTYAHSKHHKQGSRWSCHSVRCYILPLTPPLRHCRSPDEAPRKTLEISVQTARLLQPPRNEAPLDQTFRLTASKMCFDNCLDKQTKNTHRMYITTTSSTTAAVMQARFQLCRAC